MFNKLKDKLKGWIKKSKEDEEEILAPEAEKAKSEKEKPKKEVKKKDKKTKKEKQETLEEDIKEEAVEEPVKKKSGGFFKKVLTEEKFEEIFTELEMILLQNNTAYEVVESIKESLKKEVVDKPLKEVDLSKELENAISSVIKESPDFIQAIKNGLKEKKPYVILFCGINGSGKTTTIAKVANLLKSNKISVCLAAADTFRAASIEQIQYHADKLNIPLVKKDYGSDPASVGFDAVSFAKKNKIDVVLIDTAGRLQNKDSLMREIEKISRVNKPDMKIFVGESITGNDATEQAKAFNQTIDLTGVILSKADVDEKGGTALSISKVTNKPILFLGTGQEYKDLEYFNKEKIIEKLGL